MSSLTQNKSRVKLYTRLELVELLHRGVLSWMSPSKVRKYIIAHIELLEPTIQGTGSGTRYFFTKKSVQRFIRMYRNGQLPNDEISVRKIYLAASREIAKIKGLARENSMRKFYTRGRLVKLLKKECLHWMTPSMIDKLCEYYADIFRPELHRRGSMRKYYYNAKNIRKFISLYNQNKLSGAFPGSDFLSTLDIYKSKKMYWLRGHASVLRYLKEPRFEQILKPIRVEDRKSGGRFYVSRKNLEKLIMLYKKDKLKKLRFNPN